MLNDVIFCINWSILAAFLICFLYQAIFFFSRFKKWKCPPDTEAGHRYGVLIAARNEENVIGELIDSIRAQRYDQRKLTVFVVADNCTDGTADVATRHGAVCFERHDLTKTGKSYALSYLLDCLKQSGQMDQYDGFFVFDADNILDRNFIREIDRTFSQGYAIVSGYRNSTNLSENWISYGYGLWFLHESGFLNRGRMLEGMNCMISGTGYVIRTDLLKAHEGWDWFLLTEDVQLSADCICNDIRIGFNESAVYYDEQPTRLSTSIRQRMRWVKGYYQVYRQYGKQLVGKCFRQRSVSGYDMLMSYLPAFVLTLLAGFLYLGLFAAGLISSSDLGFLGYSVFRFGLGSYMTMLVLGIYTALTERGRIRCPLHLQIRYLLLFPIYMFTYFPIALAALFRRVEWKPIVHGSRCDSDKLSNGMTKNRTKNRNQWIKDRMRWI